MQLNGILSNPDWLSVTISAAALAVALIAAYYARSSAKSARSSAAAAQENIRLERGKTQSDIAYWEFEEVPTPGQQNPDRPRRDGILINEGKEVAFNVRVTWTGQEILVPPGGVYPGKSITISRWADGNSPLFDQVKVTWDRPEGLEGQDLTQVIAHVQPGLLD